MAFASEISADALETGTHHFPNCMLLGDAKDISATTVASICRRMPDAHFIITAGIPCVDVSRLDNKRRGQRGKHSGMHSIVRKVFDWVAEYTGRDPTLIAECTVMDGEDRDAFSQSLGCQPIELDNSDFAPISRPRWFWLRGVFNWPEGCA